jgi:hypothetical protein
MERLTRDRIIEMVRELPTVTTIDDVMQVPQ